MSVATCHVRRPRSCVIYIADAVKFVREITSDEEAIGFECVEHVAFGTIVTATVGIGLRAVKIEDQGVVRYAICDESLMVLYPTARSLAELRMRFALRSRAAG